MVKLSTNNILTTIIVFFIILLSVSCNSKANDNKSDNSTHGDYKDRIFRNITNGNINLYDTESLFMKFYKLNELFELLKDYSGDNVGLKIIQIKLFLYKDEYQKAIEILDDIISDYPAHKEAIFLEENVSKLMELKGLTYDNILEKGIIFRKLLFPDKSLDSLKKIAVSNERDRVWFEIGVTLHYYSDLISNEYPVRDDIVVREINRRFRSEEYKKQIKYHPGKNSCTTYSMNILTSLEFKEPFENELLDEEDFKDVEKSIKEMTQGVEKNDQVDFWKGDGKFLIFPFFKIIDKKNSYMNHYYARKHVSAVYAAKKDIGERFLNYAEEVCKKLEREHNLDSFSSNQPGDSITTNIFKGDYIIITLPDLCRILDKNYLNLNSWNGPYYGYADSDSFGYSYVFYDDLRTQKFGIVSGGPNFKFEIIDNPDCDDVSFFMSYGDLKD